MAIEKKNVFSSIQEERKREQAREERSLHLEHVTRRNHMHKTFLPVYPAYLMRIYTHIYTCIPSPPIRLNKHLTIYIYILRIPPKIWGAPHIKSICMYVYTHTCMYIYVVERTEKPRYLQIYMYIRR